MNWLIIKINNFDINIACNNFCGPYPNYYLDCKPNYNFVNYSKINVDNNFIDYIQINIELDEPNNNFVDYFQINNFKSDSSNNNFC